MDARYMDGWRDALESAANFMLQRRVSASPFYADALRRLQPPAQPTPAQPNPLQDDLEGRN